MSETLKVIEKRWSCRAFSDKVVESDLIEKIALAAVQAPSGMNRQNWQVVVVKDKKLIEEMDDEGMNVLSQMQDKTIFDRIMSRGGKLFYNAPCMMVIATKPTEPSGAELVDCGILAQNIVLAATSLGIANVHCGLAVLAFAGDKRQEFEKRLKFFQGYQCSMAVLLGYEVEYGTPHKPDLSKITYID